jgi:hypothetical protein
VRRARSLVPYHALAIGALLAMAAPAGAAPASRGSGTAVPRTIQTVPKVPGMRFSLNGRRFEADGEGRARPPLVRGGASPRVLDTALAPGVRASLDRWYLGRRIAAIHLYYEVNPSFVDLSGHRVDPAAVTAVTVEGSDGRRHVFTGRSQWLQGNRVVPESQGRKSTALWYAAQKVIVAGSNVVQGAQQRFFPSRSRKMELRLLLFSARFTVRDALLGFPIGSTVRVEFPNGREQRHALGKRAELFLRALPRGDYRIGVEGLGISSPRPLELSRDQAVELRVISWLDIGVVLMGLLSVALALLFVRRRAPEMERS